MPTLSEAQRAALAQLNFRAGAPVTVRQDDETKALFVTGTPLQGPGSITYIVSVAGLSIAA